MKQAIFHSKLWLMATILILPLSGICQNYNSKSVKGDGNVITQTRSLSTFHSIDISSGLNLVLTQGEEQIVEVKADQNFQDKIITTVENGVLKIYSKNWLKKAAAKDIYVTVAELKTLSVSGASDVSTKGVIKCKDFEADFSGGSDINLHLIAVNSKWKISGAADVDLQGSAKSAEMNISGASDVSADDFKLMDCKLVASGASDINIHVTNNLDAIVSGASDVTYTGSPKNITKKLSGASDFSSK